MRRLALALTCLVVLSCAKEPTGTKSPGSATLQVFIPLSATAAVGTVVVQITAPDIPDTLAFNLTVVSGTASGTITVPTGSNRTIIVRAFDAGGIEIFRGQKTINVVEGTNPTVTLVLTPLTGNQPIVVTLGSVVLVVSPATDTLKTGDTLRLHATVMVASGDTAVTVQWATLNPGRATVDTAGLVTAGSPGSVQIVATFGGVGGSAQLQVFSSSANFGLAFHGSNIVSIPDAPALRPSSAMTLEFWVEFDSVPEGQYGVLKDNGTSRQFHIGLNGTNSPGPLRKLRAAIHTTTGLHTADGATTIPFGVWMHVAETYDGSVLRLYLNGILDGSTTINEAMIGDPVPLTMGNNPEPYPLHGQLDEVRLWDVARTPQQLLDNLSTHLTGSEADLIGYWPLDEGSGQVVHDRTSNGDNGILGTTPTSDAADPDWVTVSEPAAVGTQPTLWTLDTTIAGGGIGDVWGSAANNVFAIGPALGEMVHFDGAGWSTVSSGTPNGLNDMWGVSSGSIYASGGNFAGTTNIEHYNGSSWSALAGVPSAQYLSGIWGLSDTSLFVVATDGSLFHFDGSTWSPMASPTGGRFEDVWGASDSAVFAVGRAGLIASYNGTSWSLDSTSTTVNLFHVWGTGPTDVFATGDAGLILHFNGGAWSAMSSGTSQNLAAIWGTSPSNVVVAGAGGTLLRYNGAVWQPMNSGSLQDLGGVWASGPSTFVVTGANGTILRSH